MKKAVVFDQNIEDQSITFVVIVARHNGQWLFCKHKDRTTFEVPGGRREAGETIWETAHRELFEESGATKYELQLIDKYHLNIDNEIKQGALFYASITELSPLPESEIDFIQLFDETPQNLTYPEVQHELMKRLEQPQLVGGGQFD
jgi:8-oxo-dGTP diphosphatase